MYKMFQSKLKSTNQRTSGALNSHRTVTIIEHKQKC